MLMSSQTAHPSKRRRLSQRIPENRFSHDACREASEVIQLSDIQYEYALLSAQLELVRKDPKALAAGGAQFAIVIHTLILTLVCRRFAGANLGGFEACTSWPLQHGDTLGVESQGRHDCALRAVDHLVSPRCYRARRVPVSRSSGHVFWAVRTHRRLHSDETIDWLLTDKLSSWTGTPADRGWRYLRQALERYDGPASNYAYTKAAFDTILGFGRSSTPPPWLIQSLQVRSTLLPTGTITYLHYDPVQEHHPEYLIQACLRFGMIDSALEHTLSMVRRVSELLWLG